MRIKHRYLISQILVEKNSNKIISKELTNQDIIFIIKEKIKELFGDVGFGSFGKILSLKFFDPQTNIFVIRIPREFEMSLRYTLICLSQIKSFTCMVRTLEVCGSSRTCVDKLKNTFIILYGKESELAISIMNLIESADI
jgi:RNase P/RNase MRP subunit POP5